MMENRGPVIFPKRKKIIAWSSPLLFRWPQRFVQYLLMQGLSSRNLNVTVSSLRYKR